MSAKSRPERRRATRAKAGTSGAKRPQQPRPSPRTRRGPTFLDLLIIALLVVLGAMVVVVLLVLNRGGL